MMSDLLRRLLACLLDRRGTTAIEYGLIAALVALGMLLAMRGLATATVSQLNNVSVQVKTATQ